MSTDRSTFSLDADLPAAVDTVGEGDRYELRELLGRGGMGEVHRAWDRQLQRPVAMKRLLVERSAGSFPARFLREARILARLVHPNVAPVLDFGWLDDRPFYTMPIIEGRALSAALAELDPPRGWRGAGRGLGHRRAPRRGRARRDRWDDRVHGARAAPRRRHGRSERRVRDRPHPLGRPGRL